MSSFKESLPDKSGHFNFHHPPPDYHHLASHPRENIFDRSGGPFPRDLHLQAPFPPPGPPIPSSILMSPHESGSSYGKPDGNLKRSQRSHGTHHEPEIGQTSKSNSWNFNTNQGFYYRVHNVDGKKHEERGSYGDGHQSGPWVDQGRSLVREINPINGFDSHSNGPFPDNFIFPSQHQHQHPHPHQQHHHHQHQHPPHQDQHAPVWFQPGFNNNNFNQQHHEPRHNNNGPGLNNRNHFEPNNNHQNQQHHPSPPPHEIRNNHRPNNF